MGILYVGELSREQPIATCPSVLRGAGVKRCGDPLSEKLAWGCPDLVEEVVLEIFKIRKAPSTGGTGLRASCHPIPDGVARNPGAFLMRVMLRWQAHCFQEG